MHVPDAAADALGKIGDIRAIPALITTLSNAELIAISKHRRQHAAGSALGEIGKAAVEPLIACLKSSDAGERGVAAWTLGKLADARAIEPLVNALSCVPKDASEALKSLGWQPENAEQRALLATATGLCDEAVNEGVAAVKPLIAALWPLYDHRLPGREKDAARALARLGLCAVEALSKALTSDNLSVREAAAQALGQIGDPRAIGPLNNAINDSHPTVRQTAIEALRNIAVRNIDCEGAVTSLVETLNNPQRDTRKAALQALGALHWKPTNSKERALYAVLHYRVSDAIAEGAIAIEPLLRSLSSPSNGVDEHRSELKALAKLGDDRVVEPLVAILKEEKCVDWLKREIIETLGELPGTMAIDCLVTELNRQGWRTNANYAAKALEKLRWQPANAEQRALFAVNRGKFDEAFKEGTAAIAALVDYLESRSIPFEPAKAVTALLRIGDDGAIALRLLLEHKHGDTRYCIAHHLCAIDAGLVGPTLRTLAGEYLEQSLQAAEERRRGEEEERRCQAACNHEWYSDYSGAYVRHRCRKCGKDGGMD